MAITDYYVSAAGGGAHDGTSEANAWTWAEFITANAGLSAGGAAGMRVNVKGSHTCGSSTDNLKGGTSTSPFIIRGYATTPGDGNQGRSNSGTGPLVTTNFPTLTYTGGSGLLNPASFTLLSDLNYVSAARLGTGPGDVVLRRVKVTSTGLFGVWVGARCYVQNCDVTQGSGGYAAIYAETACTVVNSRLKGTAGVYNNVSPMSIIGNLIYGCAGIGLNVGSGGVVSGNTIVKNGGDGIQWFASTSPLHPLIVGNLITDNGGYGFNGGASNNAAVVVSNRFNRNTSGATTNATDWIAGAAEGNDTTSVLIGEEYVDSTTDDYRLVSTSPAIAAGPLGRDLGAYKFTPAGGSAVVVVDGGGF